ncbi:MAG: carboxy-S-adenosyl-L-methionine synthase CmoA [Zetaproteobacteria bacterium]|nr:MAG: carboxy-S-adenosyl-L-methionine synthase CmoA [Zetaproteobacteria bacterium]
MDNKRDTLFASKTMARFGFNREVAEVFDDMVRRSVPGYALTLDMLAVLASEYAPQGRYVYDLGCSTGAGVAAMLPSIPDDRLVIGVDRSLDMLRQARPLLHDKRVRLVCADIRELDLRDAGLIVMNFTLQFVPPKARQSLLRDIHQALNPGGALILSEKIRFRQSYEEDFHVRHHHAFKRLQGYSHLEISRKRAALERVLVPEPLQTHRLRLHRAGFARVYTWFQCFNFASLIALR